MSKVLWIFFSQKKKKKIHYLHDNSPTLSQISSGGLNQFTKCFATLAKPANPVQVELLSAKMEGVDVISGHSSHSLEGAPGLG